MKKKLLSLLLSLTIVLTLIPAMTVSVSAEENTGTVGGYTVLLPEGVALPSGAGSDTDVTEIESTDTEWGEAGKTTWYVATGTVAIDHTVTVLGNVHLILLDDCNLTVNGNAPVPQYKSPAIRINNSNLTIYAQSLGSGMGCLTAINNNEDEIAIGENDNEKPHGDITINGGKIYAEANDASSGTIECKNVIINGGEISTKKDAHKGIEAQDCLTINGGTLDMLNDSSAISAIYGKNISITGGMVKTFAITAEEKLDISGGTINTAMIAGDEYPVITISGGSITVNNESEEFDFGIIGSSISISEENHTNPTIVNVNVKSKYGICAISDDAKDANINISGGTVNATANGKGGIGIWAYSSDVKANLVISGGEVTSTATGTIGTGIYVNSKLGNANLEISGGEVTATALGPNENNKGSSGIKVGSENKSASFKIEGENTVVCSEGKNNGIGIYTGSTEQYEAKLDVQEGKVYSKGEISGITVNDNSDGSTSNNIIVNIEGGEIKAEATGEEGVAINANANNGIAKVLIKNSKVTAIGDYIGVSSYNDNGTSIIDINNATLIAKGTKNAGIMSNSENGGEDTINILGNSTVVNSNGKDYGIAAISNVNISGGMVNSFGEMAGILSQGGITITGGNTTTNGYTQSLYGANSVNVHKATETDNNLFVTDLVEGTTIYTATSTDAVDIKSNFTNTKLVRIAPAVCYIDKNVNGKFDGNDKEYGSIQSAIKYAGAEKTIVLIADDTENVVIPAGDDITLDLNGHVLLDNGNNYRAVIEINKGSGGNSAGALTIVDNNADKLSHNFEVSSDGLWALTDKEYTKTYENLVNSPAQEGDVIKVIGGVITSDNGTGNRIGIEIYENASLTLNSGSIIGFSNTGIYNDGYFVMNNGLISGNIAVDSYGAGVQNNKSFVMKGGKITNNSSLLAGGVNNSESNSSFTMIGGTILANEGALGGVVNVGTLNIGGSAKIYGNVGSFGNNLVTMYLITIGDSTNGSDGNAILKPAPGFNVGITLLGIGGSGPYAKTGPFTKNGNSLDKQYFFSDNDDFYVKYVTDHLELAVATVKIDKNITNGKIKVDNQEAGVGTTVTITATPNSGYQLDNISVTDEDGDPITVDNSGKFVMPAEFPVTVSATFKKKASTNGSGYKVVNTGVKGNNNNTLKLISLISLLGIATVITTKKKKH